MKEKRKSKLCIYCHLNPSTKNGDHLLARCFVAIPSRDGIPKLPCCHECNRQKAKFEHYLASTLPFASREENSVELAERAVERVRKNKALAREMVEGAISLVDPLAAKREYSFAFPFRSEMLVEYSRFVVCGILYWVNGERVFSRNQIDVSFALHDQDIALTWEFLFSTRGLRINGRIGNSGLVFEGLCSDEVFGLSVIRLSYLGGAILADSSGRHSSCLWCFVNNSSVNDNNTS